MKCRATRKGNVIIKCEDFEALAIVKFFGAMTTNDACEFGLMGDHCSTHPYETLADCLEYGEHAPYPRVMFGENLYRSIIRLPRVTIGNPFDRR
jgi:hypothetical protein